MSAVFKHFASAPFLLSLAIIRQGLMLPCLTPKTVSRLAKVETKKVSSNRSSISCYAAEVHGSKR